MYQLQWKIFVLVSTWIKADVLMCKQVLFYQKFQIKKDSFFRHQIRS